MRLGGLRLSRGPFGGLADDTLRALGFMLADSRGNSADVEAMHFADRLADSVQLLNDGMSRFMLNFLMAAPQACR